MNVMVFIELRNSKIAAVSLQLLSEAQKLAASLNTKVDALVIGSSFKDYEELERFGASRVITYLDKRLDQFVSLPYADLITKAVKKYQPKIVLFGASYTGRDVAPRVASALGCGLTADCTELKIGDYKDYKNILLQIRPAFGGNIIATIVSPETSPSMATVREGVMYLNPLNEFISSEKINEPVSLDESLFASHLIDLILEEKAVDLTSSKIIVTAGMGVKDEETLSMVKDLAKVLGADLGASRPVVDSGMLKKEHQVGQTGVTVRPNIYMAFGVSGQIQHVAGMSQSKRILAVNTDPLAPIFKLANYGIVGDLKKVIPMMIKAYQEK